MTRRSFARLAGLAGTLGWLELPAWAETRDQMPPLGPAPAAAGKAYWQRVRQQFLMPPGLAIVNAANLCPTSLPVAEAVYRATRDVDADPSMPNRRKLSEAKEQARRTVAAALRVTPEEIVLTRNTSEGNNFVSSGLDLKAGDDVIVSAENHPSLLNAWDEKAKRFGFTVRRVAHPSPHPGHAAIVDAFRSAFTPATRVVALTHVTASAGDVFPVRDICRLARERGALSIVDGAQSFGILDIDLADMQPDFFTGSAHKWPCGPREVGVLFVNKQIESKLWASVVSLYSGAVGVSRRLEGLGQRNEPAIVGMAEAMNLQGAIGRAAIEARSRSLAQILLTELRRIDGVKVWTSADPAHSAAIVTFQPGRLEPAKLATALYERERIACSARSGADRPGLRLSPHFYNSVAEMERTIAAIRKYIAAGV
jgi:selenocysteine lyase/cysteine desulfurase